MENASDKRKKQIIIILVLLLLLIVGWLAYQHFFPEKPEPVTLVSGEFLPDGKDAQRISEDELAELAQTAADRSKFNLMISPEATFNHRTLQGELMIKNPLENGHPINVEIRKKSNDELVYTSGAIQPGYEIKEVTLEQSLEKGEHPSVAMFSLYDPDTNQKKGQVAAGVTLVIE
ncbi:MULTISPECIES: hypothetical protein [Enterococcus]|uniref:Uncharacterized protein n=1 Tax=Candidatus Enterococcus mangumiae TaxID=2230878 RepID=A0ABZ2T1H2_9ENTE|nr:MULTISPECIES: hypothetical protein [unclassified Enterococcus]MBO0461414.1 hypothetical protein [Enterococcus sp. DIV1298c]MBO0489895.1 hypothetical protein [Enterococcus sp. DIV1094]MBO1300577.1 hypothetical protein [Enterococcus sp. DIV1271a]